MSRHISLVIRPSGVWNSRAPLHNFLSQTSIIQRDYSLLTLAVARTRFELAHLDAPLSSPREFMAPGRSGPVASKAWRNYRDWWRKEHAKDEGQPIAENIDADLALGVYPIREWAVVKVASLFETFVQCWALNMLLAVLEKGDATWSEKQTRLASDLSPIHTPDAFPPGVPRILGAFPQEQEGLSLLPHIKTDPATGAPVEAPLAPGLNALSVALFWRDYRNLVVHRDGVVSQDFVAKHSDVFELLRVPYQGKLRPLSLPGRLQLPDVVFYAMMATHHRAARWLNQRLRDLSAGRRGNIFPPEAGIEEPVRLDPRLQARPLLGPGDHAPSLRWTQDEIFRENVVSQFPKAAAKYLAGRPTRR